MALLWCRGSVLSSGTVGAAMEAAIAGRRAIAISFPFFSGWGNWSEEQMQAAVRVAGAVSSDLWQHWNGGGSGALLYNVNVPVSVSEASHEVLFTQVDTAAQYEGLYGKRSACDGPNLVATHCLSAYMALRCTAMTVRMKHFRFPQPIIAPWPLQLSTATAAPTCGVPRR